MHYVIFAIVEAQSKHQAVDAAKYQVFKSLVGVGRGNTSVFDYYRTGDDLDEWPNAALFHSEQGQEWVDTAMDHRRETVSEALEKIQTALNDEGVDAFVNGTQTETDTALLLYQAFKIGRSRGPHIPLYDSYGRGIRTRQELKQTLEEPIDVDGHTRWIVPADVHY